MGLRRSDFTFQIQLQDRNDYVSEVLQTINVLILFFIEIGGIGCKVMKLLPRTRPFIDLLGVVGSPHSGGNSLKISARTGKQLRIDVQDSETSFFLLTKTTGHRNRDV